MHVFQDPDINALPTYLQELFLVSKPLVSREDAESLTSRAVAAGTLANSDSRNEGPKNRIRVGRRVFYPRRDFILWFAARVKEVGSGK